MEKKSKIMIRRSSFIKVQEYIADSYFPYVFLLTLVSFLIMPEKKHPMLVFNYLALLPGLIALQQLIKRQSVYYYGPLVAFFVFACLSILWSQESDSSDLLQVAKRSISIFIFTLSVSAAVYSGKIEVFLKLLLVVTAVMAAYGFVDFYFDRNNPFTVRLRSWGSLDNPLYASSVYGAFILIGMYFYLNKNKVAACEQLVIAFCVLTLFVANLFTQSKGPILSLLLALIIMLVIYRAWKYMLFIGLGLLCVAVFVFSQDELLGSLMKRGGSHRMIFWQDVINKIRLTPWFGYGMGTEYSIDVINFNIKGYTANFVTPHNRWLAAIYHTGILGFVLLIISVFRPVIKYGVTDKSLGILAVILIVYSSLCGLTQGVNWITNPDHIWVMFWMPLAILITVLSARERL